MSQGKAWDKDEVIQALEPYFKTGCSIAKACDYAGIPRTTVQTWVENDEQLRLKVTAWQNQISAKARQNWRDKIEAGDTQKSIEWLSKKEKDEFADRTEHTGDQGSPIAIDITSQLEKVYGAAASVSSNS